MAQMLAYIYVAAIAISLVCETWTIRELNGLTQANSKTYCKDKHAACFQRVATVHKGPSSMDEGLHVCNVQYHRCKQKLAVRLRKEKAKKNRIGRLIKRAKKKNK